MRVLTISDQIDSSLYDQQAASRFAEVEHLLCCGDLPYYYIEYVLNCLIVPCYFVRGNHSGEVEIGSGEEHTSPQSTLQVLVST